MKISVQMGDEQYRLVSGDIEGELADYGDPAELEVDGQRFVAVLDYDEEGEGDEVVSLLEGTAWVHRVEPVLDCEVVDVEFEVEGESAADSDEPAD